MPTRYALLKVPVTNPNAMILLIGELKGLAPACLVCLVFLAGCATVDPTASYDKAADHVRKATGETELYRPDDEQGVERRVAELLANGLTLEEAGQITLLNNREVQAALLQIGIAEADLVQSGLFSNPSLSGVLRFPSGGGLVGLEAGLAQSISDLWQIPLRRRASEQARDRTILEVAKLVADKLYAVREQYLRVVAAEGAVEIADESRDVANQLLELAVDRQEAGSGNSIDVNTARSELLKKQVLTRRASIGVVEARAGLVKLLGIAALGNEVQLEGQLPDAPERSLSLRKLQAVADEHRLDLLAAREAVDAAAAWVKLQRRMFFRVVEAGGEYEREPRAAGDSSEISVGPTLSTELPLFDQNQAQLARAEYLYSGAVKRLEGLQISVQQEVHVAYERQAKLWSLADFYKENVIPQQEESLQLAREAYQLGEVSFFSVLQAQTGFLSAREEQLKTRFAACAATVELERVAGLQLAAIPEE